jgi:hypothetical protein
MIVRTLTITAAFCLMAVACGDDDDEAIDLDLPTTTPFCAPGSATASEIDLELPRHGGDYTRHVPVEGWVDAAPGRLLQASIVGSGGGNLGSSQIEVSDEADGDLHRIETVIVLQSLPNKLDACFRLAVPGANVRLPITVGGANP